jgi:hypothetical protein
MTPSPSWAFNIYSTRRIFSRTTGVNPADLHDTSYGTVIPLGFKGHFSVCYHYQNFNRGLVDFLLDRRIACLHTKLREDVCKKILLLADLQ